MKQVIYILLCVLFITACNNNDQEDAIPTAIGNDFANRYPSSKIITFKDRSDGAFQIDFMDEKQNKASCWYVNASWKMTYTKISEFSQLPLAVQQNFKKLEYKDTPIIDIYKTERVDIKRSLYTLHFQYPRKDVEKVEHNVFMNDDGLFLNTYTSYLNDPCWSVNLAADQLDFINFKYKGSEIKGYLSNGGTHEYLIYHEGIIKFVFFRSENSTDPDFWKETRYELSKDVVIPDNVSKKLQKTDPDFTYTNIYYVESSNGNQYLFVDKNHKNELGYFIEE